MKSLKITIAVIIVALLVSIKVFFKKSCPDNYVFYSSEGIQVCVAKYEMKKGSGDKAVSQAAGKPWMDITHQEAILACQKNGEGYDLIDNHTWTLLARDIASNKVNWDKENPYNGSLNIGHSDAIPDEALEASIKDEESCYLKKERCDLAHWKLQRRTHQLSSGEVIWDFAGNAAEWIKDTNEKKQIEAPQKYVSLVDVKDQRYQNFGPKEQCETPQVEFNYCGLGYYWTHDVGRNGIGRSGYWKHKAPFMTGIFSLGVDVILEKRYDFMGFRCVYHPAQNRTHF